LSYLANTQTNKLWRKHNLLGGGNNPRVIIKILKALSVVARCRIHLHETFLLGLNLPWSQPPEARSTVGILVPFWYCQWLFVAHITISGCLTSSSFPRSRRRLARKKRRRNLFGSNDNHKHNYW